MAEKRTKQVKCYLSCISGLDENGSIKKFIDCFGDDYKFLEKQLNQEANNKLINEADIFIGIVNRKYLENISTTDEFEYARDLYSKEILLLITPDAMQLGNVTEEQIKNDWILSIAVQNFKLTIMYRNYKLEKDVFVEDFKLSTDSIEVKEIKLIINQIFENMYPTQLSDGMGSSKTKSTVSALNIKNLHNFKNKRPENGLLIRGCICEKRIIIITYKELKKSYYISMYNNNDSFSFLLEYDSNELNLQVPNLIATNTNNDIFIVDNQTGMLHAFDYDFNSIKTLPTFQLKNFNDMCVDEYTNDIYFVKCTGDSDIKVIDYKNEKAKLVEWRKLDTDKFKPKFIKVTKYEILILNAHSIGIGKTNEYSHHFGESILYILNKYTFNVKMKIDFIKYGFVQPWSLIIDKDSNIYTTAYERSELKYVSKERFLIKLNSKGEINDCNSLGNDCIPRDIIYANGKLILLEENLFYIYAK